MPIRRNIGGYITANPAVGLDGMWGSQQQIQAITADKWGNGTFTYIAGTIASMATVGSTLAVTLPSGIQAGDLIFIFGSMETTGPASATGYTSLSGAGSSNVALYKTANGTESGTTVTITFVGGSSGSVQPFAIRHSSGITPSVTVGSLVSATNLSLTLTEPSTTYIQLSHIASCRRGVTMTVSAYDADLTQLGYRSSGPAIWNGWINTTVLKRVGSTVTVTTGSIVQSILATIYV